MTDYDPAQDSREGYEVGIAEIRRRKIAAGEIVPWVRKDAVGRATVYQGDSRSRHPLNRRIGPSVARLAKRDEVRQVVRIPVVEEQSVRLDVVDVASGGAAVLADPAIARFGLSLLCGPVRPSVGRGASFVLRVQFADAMPVSAIAGAVEAAPFSLPARRASERGAASDASDASPNGCPGGYRRVLAGCRAMLAPPVLGARRRHCKVTAAMLAGKHRCRSTVREFDRG